MCGKEGKVSPVKIMRTFDLHKFSIRIVAMN